MSILSDLYEQTFQLNNLIHELNAQLYKTTEPSKIKLLMFQNVVWHNKIVDLKRKIKEYTKNNENKF